MHSRTKTILRGMGVAEVELRAIDHTPVDPRAIPSSGCGLVGGTGTGKTWRLVQDLAAKVDMIVASSNNPAIAKVPYMYCLWVNWPSQAEILKLRIGGGLTNVVSSFMDDTEAAAHLYIDDIGQERVKGEDDYALGLLKAVIDCRYRACKPLYWTSNLRIDALVHHLGARLVSRMMQQWPPMMYTGKDMRLIGAVK